MQKKNFLKNIRETIQNEWAQLKKIGENLSVFLSFDPEQIPLEKLKEGKEFFLSLENVKKIFTGKCDGSELSPLEFALDFLNKRSAMEFYSSSPESHPFWVRKNVNGKGYSKFSEFLSDNEPKANEIFAQEMSEKSKTGINVISKSPANSENVSVEVYVSPVSFFVRKEQKNDRLFIRKEMEKHNVLALANMFDFANFSEEKNSCVTSDGT